MKSKYSSSTSKIQQNKNLVDFQKREKQNWKQRQIVRRINENSKQNMDLTNSSSFNDKIRDRSYKPTVKNTSKLELSRKTISVVINDSSFQNEEEILDALLFSQFDFSTKNHLLGKFQQSDSLLLEQQDQPNSRYFKELSPIKSISESINQIDSNIFVANKIQENCYNAVLKLRKPQKKINSNESHSCILFQRLLISFRNIPQNILKFYFFIHETSCKHQLEQKIRQYLFQNSIIFNKKQLGQLIRCIQDILKKVKCQTDFMNDFCQSNYGELMERLFLSVENYQQSKKIWLIQDVIDKAFCDSNMISLWKLSKQLFLSQKQRSKLTVTKEGCFTTEDNYKQTFEIDFQKKQQCLAVIGQWISSFIKILTPSTIEESVSDGSSQEIVIKIREPLLH